ncbi:MAG: hypothetical protein FWD76_00380 [Firmicutes bacterium]|nr:hypothetical protein [Bacillota bacterium]
MCKKSIWLVLRVVIATVSLLLLSVVLMGCLGSNSNKSLIIDNGESPLPMRMEFDKKEQAIDDVKTKVSFGQMYSAADWRRGLPTSIQSTSEEKSLRVEPKSFSIIIFYLSPLEMKELKDIVVDEFSENKDFFVLKGVAPGEFLTNDYKVEKQNEFLWFSKLSYNHSETLAFPKEIFEKGSDYYDGWLSLCAVLTPVYEYQGQYFFVPIFDKIARIRYNESSEGKVQIW